jgi:hypothetical protein
VERKCVIGEGLVVNATDAFRAYRAWALDAGLSDRETLNATRFGTRIKTRFGGVHRKTGNVYLGVGLLAADRPSASAPA